MKNLTIILALISTNLGAQILHKNISRKQIGDVNVTKNISINTITNDTVYHFSLDFVNNGFGSLNLDTKSQLNSCIVSLKQIEKFATDTTIYWTSKEVDVFYGNSILIKSSKNEVFVSVTLEQIRELRTYLETIELPIVKVKKRK